MRIVLDTNILVSALLTPHGAPDRVVRLAVAGRLIPLYDERMLSEYREVLSRPKFPFAESDVHTLLAQIERSGEAVLGLPLAVELPDADDLPFLEVAVAGAAQSIVTGNASHFRPVRGSHAIPILSPAELLALLAREAPSGG